MDVLVTGGIGYVGGELVKHLRKQGHRVFSYDVAEGWDITDYDALRRLFKAESFDAVYHLAAQPFIAAAEENPYRDVEVNVFGMLNLLRCLEDYPVPMVYTSSGAVYGRLQVLPFKEDAPCMPTTNYAASKLAAEKYLQKWVAVKGIDARITRFCSVYGAGRRHGPVNVFIDKALRGEPLTVYGRGVETRDFTHVSDAVQGLESVMERGRPGEVYNVGTGEEHSVGEVALIVQWLTGAPIVYERDELPPHTLRRCWLDVSKARSLGYVPRVDLEVGIASTLSDTQRDDE